MVRPHVSICSWVFSCMVALAQGVDIHQIASSRPESSNNMFSNGIDILLCKLCTIQSPVHLHRLAGLTISNLRTIFSCKIELPVGHLPAYSSFVIQTVLIVPGAISTFLCVYQQ